MRISRYRWAAAWVLGVMVSWALLFPQVSLADQPGLPASSGMITATPEGGGCVDSVSRNAGSCRNISTCIGTAASQETCMLGYICCIGMSPSVSSTSSSGLPSTGTPSSSGLPSTGTPLGTPSGFPSTSFGVTCQAGTVLENGICLPVGTGLSRGETTSTSYSFGFFTFSISSICTLGPVACVLATFMNWILAILGFVAIISFVIAGLQYLLALGEPKELERAKNHFRWSIIGIIVALSGMVIIYAVDSLLNGYSRF